MLQQMVSKSKLSFELGLARAAVAGVAASSIAGCGGGGGSAAAPGLQTAAEHAAPGPTIVTASVYPAVAGLVFVEYDADGNELQKSAPTQADGSFSLTGPLSGTRLQALGTPSGATVAPLYSTQLRAASLTASRLQVTALTTWHDQLRKHGVAEEEAANRVVSLVAGNCLAQFDPTDGQQAGALHADMIVPAHNHDWLLSAVSAYLQSARAIGLGPQVDFNGWNKVLDKRGELLAQLCQYASSVSAASWKEKQALRVQTEAKVAAVDNARLDAAISEARTQGLALLARRIQLLEYPDQTAVLLPQTTAVQGQEMSLASNFVMAQYKLQASTTKSQALVAPPTPMLLGVTSTGQIVGAVQASATPTVDATALLRLSNRGGEDKRVGLTLNGQNMADLGGVLEHILALPVAHTGEPLYRKAWRYVIAQRQRTVPVAIGNFQYQPDLWLRSVGSSYCEAQATALHFIWKAMGYEARVIGLTGHVVPEVRIDGRWQVFDPYLATYYTDRGGANIVGVSELQQDTSLVSNPATPLLPLPDTAYSQLVADFYGSTDDNFPLSSVMTPTVQPMGNELQVPAGGYVDFDASAGLARPSTEPGHQVSMAQLRLWVPPGYKGVIKLPLLLVDVKGVGQVTMFGRSLDPSVTNVGALLNDFLLLSNSEVGVSELVIDSVGTGGLTLTLMLNPLYFSNRQHLTVRAFGPDVKGLSFDGEATAMPAQPL